MSSVFSGKAGRQAAIWGAGLLDQRQGTINDLIAQYTGNALGAIDQGQTAGLGALKSGYTGAVDAYRKARSQLEPYAATGQSAFGQYADASGVNGQAGYDRVQGNFRASPGYQYMVDQSSDALARKASSLGALGGGNTMAAISDRAGHLADQEYDDYLSRLSGLGQVGYNAETQQAGITKAIGDLRNTYGAQRATTLDNNAADRSNIYQYGTGLGASSNQHTADSIANLGYKGMTAGADAAATRLNFGLGVAGTALNLLGLPTGGGGSIGGSLFKTLRPMTPGSGGLY